MRRIAAMAALAGVLAATLPAAAQVLIEPDGAGSFEGRVGPLDVLVGVAASNERMFTADITVRVEGDIVFQRRDDEIFAPYSLPIAKIVEMDPQNDMREVFVAQYSGGAHCCTLVSVVTQTGDGWGEVELGTFDGGLMLEDLRDVDFDGTNEFVAQDMRFLYQFAPYAGSYAPRQILGLRGGARADLSADAAFAPTMRAALDGLGAIPESGESRNSWLAAHTAIKLRLGDDDAFERADTEYDASVDWGMRVCADPGIHVNDCPDDRVETLAFPVALRRFLTETGYLE